MKNDTLKSLTMTTFCLLLAMSAVCGMMKTVGAVEPSEPHPANAIWIEPSTKTIDNTTVNLGYKFNITVFVNITAESYSWQVKLFFNTTYFNVSRIEYTAGSTSEFFSGLPTMPLTPLVNYENGYLQHGESLLGAETRAAGYGSLIWVEFNLTKIPPQNNYTVEFSSPVDSLVLDPNLDDILMDTMDNTDIIVIPEFPQLAMLLIITITSTLSIIATRKLRR